MTLRRMEFSYQLIISIIHQSYLKSECSFNLNYKLTSPTKWIGHDSPTTHLFLATKKYWIENKNTFQTTYHKNWVVCLMLTLWQNLIRLLTFYTVFIPDRHLVPFISYAEKGIFSNSLCKYREMLKHLRIVLLD